MSTLFSERQKALEESFFREREKEILTRIRKEQENVKLVEKLKGLSGINDNTVLNKAVELGIRPETFSALGLVPLIKMCWADKVLEEREKIEVLKAMDQEGITPNSPAYQLLQSWMNSPINEELWSTWKSYVKALNEQLSPEERKSFQTSISERVKKIGLSSGALMGLGSLSGPEKEFLKELEETFL